jgi:hypothetical protein
MLFIGLIYVQNIKLSILSNGYYKDVSKIQIIVLRKVRLDYI